MARRRKPSKGQLGFGGLDSLPDESAREEHVSPFTRRVPDPLPAELAGGVAASGNASELPGRAGGSHADATDADSGTDAGEISRDEPDTARDGGGPDGAGDVSDAQELTEQQARYAALQQNGLYGIAPERAIMRVDLPPEDIPTGGEAPSLIQAGLPLFDAPEPSENAAPTPAASPPVKTPQERLTTPRQSSPPAVSTERPHRPRVEKPKAAPKPEAEEALSPAITPTLTVVDAPPAPLVSPMSSGLKGKAKATVAALHMLKTLEAEERPATQDEKEILARFSGFGPLANHIFPEPGTENYKEGWVELGRELAALLTDAEYASAKRSTFSAFYTSPTIMQAIYDGLDRMGVPDEVHVLEPGCGIGNFIGTAPEGMHFTGVEQDQLSGRIARLLYPEADIRIEPFQKSHLPEGGVDVVVGNVPFSDLKLAWQDERLSLHEYFFAKSLDSLQEGGVMALVTSRYTLDKKDATFRETLAKSADFLSAIRLPKGAFRQEGTEVVTDIIFLRKRGPEQVPDHTADWLETDALPGFEAHCNQYFLAHPEMVIGELTQTQGMYRDHELSVPFPDDYEARLQAAIDSLPQGAWQGSALPIPERFTDGQSATAPLTGTALAPRSLPPGSLFVDKEGGICQVRDDLGTSEPMIRGSKPVHSLSGVVGTRLTGLIGIRDAARTVLATQREERPEEEREAARTVLNQRYDRFVEQWGPINKTNISTTAKGVTVRRQPNLTGFKDDPDTYLVMALEAYDEKRDTATKMPIMERDVIGPTPPVDQVESALDGLLVCLNERGKVEIARIGQLYDATPEAVIEELEGHIYYDPAKQAYVTTEEYLSGNVREKLRIAKEQADDPRVAGGIEALEAAQPAPIPPGDIDIMLGASWIPTDVIQTFVADLLGADAQDITVRHVEKEALWRVEAPEWVRHKVEATSTYGTQHRPALTLINDALNMRVPTVTQTVSIDGKDRQVPDQEATLAAREKQKAIKHQFQQWIVADPERADQLTDRYNQQFNTVRLRAFDGEHLTFPDMNPDIELRPHQKDAVWRVMSGENSLLAHVVGAGKTFEMIASGMKMQQTGLVRKPLYAVPNHMLEQFSREFYQLYPDAKLLVASKDDLAKENRQLFTAKAASGEWDGIIMTHSSFEKIGMSPDFQESFVREQIDEYEALLTDMKAGSDSDSNRLIKRIEKQKEQWEQKLEELLNAENKDKGLTFEDLGVDHLFVDEAHLFKNLETPTKMGQVAGVQTTGSLRAFDLFMKGRYLDQHGHGTTFATGTPVSNSMVEMYTMSRFLAPELLQERGIAHFDGWAAVFGEIVDTIELSPDAQSLRQNRRFAKFVNLPELLQIFHSFADVKTADMLDLPTPAIAGGKAEVIATPMTPYQERIQQSLVSRYERVRAGSVDPRDDNALKITTDGRKLALDARLNLPHLPEDEGKIDAVADQVYDIWQRTQETKSTQLLFCDLGVSNKNGQFSVYDAIIDTLEAKGIPADEIANIGDYKTDQKKARLFEQVRSGDVRILLGSTAKMGTGTNVQERLYALHHVDAPWKPAEVEQREGRILRQGNAHEEVEIYRYVTEGSFDAYMWQTLQTKAEFINQVMKGDMSIRRIEDMDDQSLSYAEVKAIASGNPAVLTLAKMDMEVQKLTQLSRAHTNEQYSIRQQIRQMEDGDLLMLQRWQDRIREDIATIEAHGGEAQPTLILNGQTVTNPKQAQEMLRTALEQQWEQLAFSLLPAIKGGRERTRIGSFGGLDIELILEKGNERISGRLALKGAYEVGRSLRGPGSDRLLDYLHELAGTLSERQQKTAEEQAAVETHLDSLQTRLGLPFEQETTLTQLTEMRGELQALLQSDAPAHPDATEASEPGGEQPQESATQDNAPPKPSPEEIEQRVQALVAAFDSLMRGEAPSVDDAEASEPPPTAPDVSQSWAERVRPKMLTPQSDILEVA